MKKVIVTVSSDLVTDQRVLKECSTLYRLGYEIEIYCRILNNSLPLPELPYKIIRLKLVKQTGMLMFIHLNWRLFFSLLKTKGTVYWANDLDTLLPAFLVSKIKGKPLVYDSHEYYTFTSSLVNRPIKKWMWETMEKIIFPRLKYVLTVNESIRAAYENKYGINIYVLRNVPYLLDPEDFQPVNLNAVNKKIILIQGAGIHKDRGNEEAIAAMKLLDDTFLLIIIGDGDALADLKSYVDIMHLHDKVRFIARMPYNELVSYTMSAHVGLAVEPITRSPSSMLSLPNKLFDYIQAGLPVIASRGTEMERIISGYGVGEFIPSHSPQAIADTIRNFFSDPDKIARYKYNASKAAEILCWENEEKVLIDLMNQIENDQDIIK